MKTNETQFAISQEIFNENHKAFKDKVVAKHFYQIGFALQFRVPLEDSFCVSIHASHSKYGTYGIIALFKQVEIKNEVSTSIKSIGFAFHTGTKYKTYVEFVFFCSNKIHPTDVDEISQLIIRFLNSFLISYSFLASDTTTFLVSKQSLKSPVLCRIFTDWNDDSFSVSILNFNSTLGLNDKPLNNNQIKDIQTLMSCEPLNNPLLTSQEIFAYDSLISYRTGRLRESVINIQSAIESLLIRLYAFVLIEEKSFEQAKFENNVSAYKNFINHHLTEKLNVTWDWNDGNTEFGRYNLNTYQMRNKIIHEGHEPTPKEANIAIRTGLEFREYVISLILNTQYEMIKKTLKLFYFNRSKTFSKDVFDTFDDFHFDRLKEYGKDSGTEWIWSERGS